MIFSLILIFFSSLVLNFGGIESKNSFIYVISALTNSGESLLILGNLTERIETKYYFILNILMICGRFEYIGYLLVLKKIIK